jgi:hypothetical protein
LIQPAEPHRAVAGASCIRKAANFEKPVSFSSPFDRREGWLKPGGFKRRTGQLHATCAGSPPRLDVQPQRGGAGVARRRGAGDRVVALQDAFERQTLKPGFSLDRL